MQYIERLKTINEESRKQSILKKIALAVFILVLMVASFSAGLYISGRSEIVKELAKSEALYLGKVLGKYGAPEKNILTQDINFDLFWDVWDTLKEEYVDKSKLNEKEMFYGAISGMVSAVGDPYTVFMDPKMSKEFDESLSGVFEGIGAEIGIRDEILTIIAPLAGTPAEKAGLRAGDKVYAIDGESTAGINVEEAVRKIRGQKGTNVILTVSRDGIESAEDITVTRDMIIVKSVNTKVIGKESEISQRFNLKDDIYLLEVSNFNDDTISLFNKAVNEIIRANPKGIVLDLRNNPGGYLETAIELASEWIEEGVIVTEEFSETEKNEFPARGKARLKDYKTVVLLNQGSASASEIVAGALKDYGRAAIIGMKSFGKGSVQTMEEFYDGSSIKITVAKWLTPKGNDINEQGIKPDVEVDMAAEDYNAGKDPQMDKAMETIKKMIENENIQ